MAKSLEHGASDAPKASSGKNNANAVDAVVELCAVCSDVSTGYHYAVPSCNGCKTFFRRTIMKKQNFVCQYEGKCPVDKSIRCACRHCRFQKCLKVGMDRNAIQQNRDPIGYTKRTRRYPPAAVTSKASPTMTASSVPVHKGEISPLGSVSESGSTDAADDDLLMELLEVEKQCEQLRNSEIDVDKSLLDAVLAPCIFDDSRFMMSQANRPRHSYVELRPAKQPDYTYWHERDWMLMIEWAKRINAYQKLSINDKLALLRHSAITYPSLLQCFYSPDVGRPDTIVFPDGAFFDRTPEPERPLGFQKRKYQMLDQLLNPMRRMEIDMCEFAAFKAIFFLNPDADDVDTASKTAISDARYSLTNALYRYMVKKKGVTEASERFGRLLLMGTVLATMAVEMKEAVVVADFFDQIRFSNFTKQLLFKQEST